MALKTDYKDDVLDTSVNAKRVYNLVDQSGNTVMSELSLEDVTVYLQKGDEFGAQEVNELIGRILTVSNVSVETSEWGDSENGTDFPYYANVAIEGVTKNHVPNVNFSLADSLQGIFASVCESHDGYVTIHASEKPSATVTIPTIQCIKS